MFSPKITLAELRVFHLSDEAQWFMRATAQVGARQILHLYKMAGDDLVIDPDTARETENKETLARTLSDHTSERMAKLKTVVEELYALDNDLRG